MNRKLIIDGNAVYEIDEECMLQKRIKNTEKEDKIQKESVRNIQLNTRKDME